MKKFGVFILAGLWGVMLVVMAVGQPVTTHTYIVNPSSAASKVDDLTLQKACAPLKPGDHLIATKGDYGGVILGWDGPNSGDYSLISGTAAAPIIIEADPTAPAGSVRIVSRNNKTPDGFDTENGHGPVNYVILKGFTIIADKTITRTGIRFSEGTGYQIINNTVNGNKIASWGITTTHSTDCVVEGNEAFGTLHNSDGTHGHGIYVGNSPVRPIIRNNRIHDNGTEGIQINADLSQGGTGITTGAIITGNTIWNNGHNGFNFDGIQNSTITGNLVYGNAGQSAAFYESDASGPSINNIVNFNTFYAPNSTGAAVKLVDGAKNNTFKSNMLIGKNGPFEMSADSTGTIQSANSTDATIMINPAGGNFHIKPGGPQIGYESATQPATQPTTQPIGTPADARADVNGDGIVDIRDLTIVANNWQAVRNPDGTYTKPPATQP